MFTPALLGPDDDVACTVGRSPRRVLVAGVAGSGKTTLAGRIGELWGLPHTEIDGLHWGPGWTPRPEFVEDVRALAAGDAWVTEWQYHQVRPLLLERAEVLVGLDLPTAVVITTICTNGSMTSRRTSSSCVCAAGATSSDGPARTLPLAKSVASGDCSVTDIRREETAMVHCSPTRSTRRPLTAALAAAVTAGLAVTTAVAPGLVPTTSPATAAPRHEDKIPMAVGYGGAISTVDPEASRIGLEVLRKGGNAVDAAVATAAALGVTEPYSAGIGGGGFFVHYDADTGEVTTIDGRETAPAAMPTDAFIDPATSSPYRFSPDLVTSGVSVGTPGTPATWEVALTEWGTLSLGQALKPATQLARRGFVVDDTFRRQTLDNAERFAAFPATAELFLPDGDAPAVGTIFRNRDLAATYDLLAKHGTSAFYTGDLAAEMVSAVTDPVTDPGTDLPVPPGYLALEDLAGYEAIVQDPTHVRYRDYDVYGMAPPSSGGSTVGEALNILETFDLPGMSDADYLHHYLEASALSFADRGAYLGDAAFVDVPLDTLLSDDFAAERACLVDPTTALAKPLAPGDVDAGSSRCGETVPLEEADTENISTTNLTVVDGEGNIVEYTLTIEQTGGSGMVVPGRGFLLNNELTDFSLTWDAADPNRIEPGKRPRSSMAPTLVLRDGEPVLALGSPGGSTIITTVLQTLTNRLDRGMDIAEALSAPRATQRNTAAVLAEPEFIELYGEALRAYGHTLVPSGDQFTSAAEIGAATAVEFGPDGLLTAVSEPRRRGGGAAMVLEPVSP